MKLAIDLDGVVFNLIQSWLDRFHPGRTYEDMDSWSGFSNFDSTIEEFMEEVKRLEVDDIIIYTDAPYVLNKLSEDHSIFFLTDKTFEAMEWTVKALHKYGLGNIPVYNVYKRDIKKEDLNYDYLLDDCPLRENDGRLIIFDQPWNRSSAYFKYRVYGWFDFLHFIENL